MFCEPITVPSNSTNSRLIPVKGSVPFSCKEKVKKILLRGDDATPQEKAEALIKIIFRLRNNLFHGEKDVGKLYEQNESFAYANQFLLNIVEKHKKGVVKLLDPQTR